MLRISILGSGSGGNSAVITTGQTTLLVDAGLSAKQLVLRLEAVGVDPESLDGILITHEHGDHIRGLDVFCRHRRLPVYSNPATREVMVSGALQKPKTWRLVGTGGKFMLGDIEVQTFPVTHDATEPMGFALRDEDSAIGILSDLGYVTNMVRNQMRDVNTLFVEANYDGLLLQNDTKRPWSTKQRILSRHGHLSNDQTAALVAQVAGPHLHHVILGHLSQDCNEPDLATAAVNQALGGAGQTHVRVECATQQEPTVMRAAVPGVPEALVPGTPVLEAEVREEALEPPLVAASREQTSAPVPALTLSYEQGELF